MFLVDANVLIEAKNRYYGFDIAPGFWDWLDMANGRSIVCSIEPVRMELLNGTLSFSGQLTKAQHVILGISPSGPIRGISRPPRVQFSPGITQTTC